MSAAEVICGVCVVNMLVVDCVVIIVSRSPCSRSPTISQTQSIHALISGGLYFVLAITLSALTHLFPRSLVHMLYVLC